MWPTSEEIFNCHIKTSNYGAALTLADNPKITEECLRATIVYLMTIANDTDQDQKTRLKAFYAAQKFYWKRESFKNDLKLSNDLFKSEFALQPPMWAYI